MSDVVETEGNLEQSALPSGLKYLVKGYADYATEVVVDRAIPGIDGFKLVNRRILYTMYLEKATTLKKCADIVGATMRYHPHGDGPIYEALTHMTNVSEYQNVPFIYGKGYFGKAFDKSPAAAYRYTECKFMPIADELFKDFDAVTMIPSYDNKRTEPELFPVTFPNILCNPTLGIAVGLSSNIPSFNFNDVNNAVIDLLTTGRISKPLYPDFPTGSEYVKDEREISKLMKSGSADITLRGTWRVEGKTIYIDSIPYYTTCEAIQAQIAAKKIPNIVSVDDATDLNGFGMIIEVNNKKNVGSVLKELLRQTNLQMTTRSNITVIYQGKPVKVGVEKLLGMWIEERRKVVTKHLKNEYEALSAQLQRYTYLSRLLNDDEKYDAYTMAMRESAGAMDTCLYTLFPDIPKEVVDWITGMSGRTFASRKSKSLKLDELKSRIKAVSDDLNNIDAVIVRELTDLNARYQIPRKTVVTDVQYDLTKEESEEVRPDIIPVVVQMNGKFIKKIQDNRLYGDLDGIHCYSNDTIACIDNHGRIIRVYLENIPFCSPEDRGTYIPVYLEEEDNFEIMCYELVGEYERAYLYNDGYVGVVDYSEWAREMGRKVRVTEVGVSPLSGRICGEVDLSKPFVMVVTDKGSVGIASTEFKHKARTARTKLIDTKGETIRYCLALSETDVWSIITHSAKYFDRVSKVKTGDTLNTELMNKLIKEQYPN